MIRKVIEIDEEKCTGCGICADACHEGAIGMVNGKARLLREDYCDGLGDCLPACPAGAIQFVEREAAAYDEQAVRQHKQGPAFRLSGWPIQIKLLPVKSPAFDGADLLIAADCTGYAYGAFRETFLQGRAVLIGCPKLDSVDYSEKLSVIFRENEIRSITVTRMEVPCCRGLEMAVQRALQSSGKSIPVQVAVISTDGKLLSTGGSHAG